MARVVFWELRPNHGGIASFLLPPTSMNPDELHIAWTQTLARQPIQSAGQTIGRVETIGIEARPNRGEATSQQSSSLLTWSSLPALAVSEEAATDNPDGADILLVRELGLGGMGRIDLAQQTALSRDVALKRLLNPENRRHVDALLREAYLTGRLEHPNIIPIHLVGRHESLGPIVVMKRVVGDEWTALLEKEPGQSSDDNLTRHLEILLEVCQALAFAHEKGIVHRDLKPANVMVGDFGQVYLLDWGIAVSLDDPPTGNHLAGTPAYMAPEMTAMDPAAIDQRTDVFLLGATLYQILAGEPLYSGYDGVVSTLAAAASAAVPPLPDGLPAALRDIYRRACAVDPKDRFQTVVDFESAIKRYLSRRPAISLTNAASTHLGTLQEVVQNASESHSGGAGTRALVLEAYSRARFGFEQALEIWPEYQPAKDGLQATLRCMFDFEITDGHADAAEALLPMLNADEDARQRLAELKSRQSTEASEIEALKRDQNLAIGRRERILASLGVVIAGTVLSAVALNKQHESGLEPWNLVVFGGAITVISYGVIWIWRKQLTSTRVSRALVAMILTYFCAINFNRVLAWYRGVDPSWTLTVDLLLFAMLAGSAIAWIRAAPAALASTLLAAVAAAVWPESAGWFFSLLVLIGGVILVGDWALEEKRQSEQKARSTAEQGSDSGNHP